MYRRWTSNLWATLTFVFYLGLMLRLFFIQVIHKDRYRDVAMSQSRTIIKLQPERGSIYDRNYNLLAYDIDRYSYWADPKNLQDKYQVAKIFAGVTGNNVSYYLGLLERDEFVWLARGVDRQTSTRIVLDPSNPLNKIKEIGRFYPYQKAAAHVLGFTNIDHVGLAGVERTFNQLLEGEPGFRTVQVDARRMLIPVLGAPEKLPKHGKSLILTLDIKYQLIAEEELRRGIQRYGAKSGMVVILDPYTGEVLAMVSNPSFNPNHFSSYRKSERRNRVLVDPYEPGSTFKLVAAAAALQEGILRPEDRVYCENGRKYFPGGAITDHKPYGTLTFAEVFSHSSNIGFAKIARRIGKKRLYQYGRAFGFGAATGIDLPGEDRGKFSNPVHWSESDLVRFPIGYGVLTTAIQLANAYAVVANGGYLLKPRIVKSVISEDIHHIYEETRVDTIRRVLTPATVAQLKMFMQKVVESGTGVRAAVQGLAIAGKTGTTKKYDHALGRYSDRKYIASFVGFTPIQRPQLVCLVVLDEPDYQFKYGGQSAAPVFRNIVRRIHSYITEPEEASLQITRNNEASSMIRLPDVTKFNVYQAKSILQGYDFQVRLEGNGGYVISQQPEPGKLLQSGEVVKLVLGDILHPKKKPELVPNVIGKSIREAVEILIQSGFDPLPDGSGYVVSQQPPPHTIAESRRCRIVCREPVTG